MLLACSWRRDKPKELSVDAGDDIMRAKARLRRDIRATRAAIAPVVKAASDRGLIDVLRQVAALRKLRRVAAYAPLPDEPGAQDLPDRLLALGLSVVLPAVVSGRTTLAWAAYDGELVPGPWGLRQPPAGRLSDAFPVVDLVLVPALAVDRRGVRLGQGGGYYDRTLAAGAGATPVPVACLLYDVELVDRLPAGAHDVRVDAVITPTLGWSDLQ